MARPVTLFTGQWGDLSLEEMCVIAQGAGYDGLELACWGRHRDGPHLDVLRARSDPAYCKNRWEILRAHQLTCFAVSNHLAGQCVCDDPIDERHRAIVDDEIWGDGAPEGVRFRAAHRMIQTGEACRAFMDAKPGGIAGAPSIVNGFTGSSIWKAVYAFPPVGQDFLDAGYRDFAKRWGPILDAFDKVNVDFGLEAHPGEIAFDIATAKRAVKAVNDHRRFNFNYDPSHLGYQRVNYLRFLRELPIGHVHMKDAWWGVGDGTVGTFGGHTKFGDVARDWDFRSIGHGMIDFEGIIVGLNDIDYQGPLSVEWEDERMQREYGAADACRRVRKMDFPSSKIAFDAAFQTKH